MELSDFDGYRVLVHHEKMVTDLFESVRTRLTAKDGDTIHMLAALRELPQALLAADFENYAPEGSMAHDLFIRPICIATDSDTERKYLLALVIRELAGHMTSDPISSYSGQERDRIIAG